MLHEPRDPCARTGDPPRAPARPPARRGGASEDGERHGAGLRRADCRTGRRRKGRRRLRNSVANRRSTASAAGHATSSVTVGCLPTPKSSCKSAGAKATPPGPARSTLSSNPTPTSPQVLHDLHLTVMTDLNPGATVRERSRREPSWSRERARCAAADGAERARTGAGTIASWVTALNVAPAHR